MTLKWNDPQPWEISGEAWRKLGQWQKAARCWEEALRMNPANPRAHLALVELYDQMKEAPPWPGWRRDVWRSRVRSP